MIVKHKKNTPFSGLKNVRTKNEREVRNKGAEHSLKDLHHF